MTATLVEHFKEKARSLVKAVRDGDRRAADRVTAHLREGVVDFGHMKALFIVAREAGFDAWNCLIEASEIELQLAVTMDVHYYLHAWGISNFHMHLPHEERMKKFREDRDSLRRSVRNVEWAVSWLRENVRPTKTINMRRSSYGLKHLAERYSPERYLPNGVFIAAAMIARYPCKIPDDSRNAYFGMSEKSLKVFPLGA